MNERIKELAHEAGLPTYNPNGVPTKLEKFAELVISECMKCATWVGSVNQDPVEPVHTAHAIKKRIAKHFGVEE